jgi:hypothetical protein
MDNRSFDGLTRSVAGISRRTTLRSLSVAGIAALVGPLAAGAKKDGNNNKKKRKRKQNNAAPLECPPPVVDLCPAQVESCTAILAAQCGGDPVCADTLQCCSRLETCDASGFWACLLTASG